MQVKLEHYTVKAPPEWEDVTARLPGTGNPLTLARQGGVGGMQLSVAPFAAGQVKMPSEDQLLEMVRRFGTTRGWPEPFDELASLGLLPFAGASFRVQTNFIRLWFVSNGTSVLMITYLCDWGVQTKEVPECEKIVGGIHSFALG